jgi:hypothetical protein
MAGSKVEKKTKYLFFKIDKIFFKLFFPNINERVCIRAFIFLH